MYSSSYGLITGVSGCLLFCAGLGTTGWSGCTGWLVVLTLSTEYVEYLKSAERVTKSSKAPQFIGISEIEAGYISSNLYLAIVLPSGSKCLIVAVVA
jgi:hypothetical protein